MKTLTTLELADILDTKVKYIQSITKTAKDSNQSHITIKGKIFYFRNKLVGKGYEFSEVPFNEHLTDDKSSLKDNSINNYIVNNIVKAPIVEISPLDKYSEEKREEALLRQEVVKGWRKSKSNGIKRDKYLEYINAKEKFGKITVRKINYWSQLYEDGGLDALVDKRGLVIGSNVLSDEYKAFILKNLRATQGGLMSIAEIYRNLHDHIFAENGKPELMLLFLGNNKKFQVVGVDAVRREVERFKKNSPTEYYQLTRGYDRLKGLFDSAYGSMDNALYRCEEFQLDMTPANFMVVDENGRVYRPKVTTVIDTFSRRAIMIISETANSYTAVKALIKAIEKLGTPFRVRTDNGADYLSRHFDMYLAQLRIEHEKTGVGSGRENAFVERLHQLQDKNLKYLDNYLGRNVSERTTQEQQTPKKDRLKGVAKKTHQLVELQIDEAMTMIDKVIDLNELTYHSTLECTPLEKYNSDTTPITFTDINILLAFAGKSDTRKYGKKGISINKVTFAIVEMHNELVGRVVRYRENIRNPHEVFLYLDNEYKGTAYSELSGHYGIKDYQKANREFDKMLRANKKQFDSDSSYMKEFTKNSINTAHEIATQQGAFDRPMQEEVYVPAFHDELSLSAKQITADKKEIQIIEAQNQNTGGFKKDYKAGLAVLEQEKLADTENQQKRKIG